MNNALTVITKTSRRFFAPLTRKSRIGQLEDLTKSLTTNTNLVAKKYQELVSIEAQVHLALENIKREEYDKEFKEIDSLDALSDTERKTFKNSLLGIKEKGIKELTPITASAQRIKAHMLITLNKALTQKTILATKSSLTGNAYIQLETLKIAEKETENLNVELEKLLVELDDLNKDAITKYGVFKGIQKGVIGEDTNAVGHVMNKLEKVTLKK